MSERACAWLAQRADGVPPALVARMQEAVEDVAQQAVQDDVERVVDHHTVPAVLVEAACTCLRDALAIGDDRAAALHLLAADALITYACEAATDDGGDALDRLLAAAAPERLTHLVDWNASP